MTPKTVEYIMNHLKVIPKYVRCGGLRTDERRQRKSYIKCSFDYRGFYRIQWFHWPVTIPNQSIEDLVVVVSCTSALYISELFTLNQTVANRSAVPLLSFTEIPSSIFSYVIHARQAQSKRTIFVRIVSKNSVEDVQQYCSQFGHISNAYFYTLPKYTSSTPPDHDNAATEAFQVSAFPNLSPGMAPAQSSFLWFRDTPTKRQMKAMKQPTSIQLNAGISIYASVTKVHINVLSGAASVTDQILKLYENARLKDLSIRLRFLGTLQIQRALNVLFLNRTVLPFGSTVNGFGKLGSVLDLILLYNCDDKSFNHRSTSMVADD